MKTTLLITIAMVSTVASAFAQSAYHNQYVQVLETKDCNDTIIVADLTSTPWLDAGDRVLIIQMKGGNVKYAGDHFITANKESGPVRYDNGAGSFEFATVDAVEAVTGTSPQQYRVLLTNPLKNLYEAELWGGEPNGVQLVRVATDPGNTTAPFLYDDVTISSTIDVPDWNGTTGGVYVLEISGILTLSADIDANGAGYVGGVASLTTVDERSRRDKVYEESSHLGSEKGEGIDIVRDPWNTGRGAAGNGGGGGNAEGAGGGGGSNYGAGGMGGMQRKETNGKDVKNGGEGGNAFPYDGLGVRVVMGAGGGAGHGGFTAMVSTLPARAPTSGARGGGIIIIRAAKVIANGGDLLANGTGAAMAVDAGAGGGGAGGTVVVVAGSYGFVSKSNVEVKGGRGGDAQQKGIELDPINFPNVFTSAGCFGPGGGGGGGLVWLSTNQAPSTSIIEIVSTGGVAGEVPVHLNSSAASGCVAIDNREAQDGSPGTIRMNLVLPGDPLP